MKKIISLLIGAMLVASVCLPTLAACDDVEPHDHVVAEWSQTKLATCTVAGQESGVCTVCGETVTREVAPLGHDFVHASFITEPTCTQGGKETVVCTRGDAQETRDVPAKGHNILDKNMRELVSSATCTADGLRRVYCPDCGQVVDDVMPALGHQWMHMAYTTEPTCTEGGVEDVVCSRCNEEESRSVAALGHDWNSFYTVEKPATFEEEGSKYFGCSRCDAKNEVTVIPRLDPNTPAQYQFRLVRTNGDAIKFAGVKGEIFDGDERVGAVNFRNGAATAALLPKTYTVKISDAPVGYTAAASYTVSWEDPVLDVVLTGSLITTPPEDGTQYTLGSVMNDLTVQTIKTNAKEAETLRLSALLEEYEIVVLNFWDVSCSFCAYEFPGLEGAYKQYKDKVAVIAIDDPDGMDKVEDESAVRTYVNGRNLTFHVAMDTSGLAELFNISASTTGYPVTIVIDREGVVSYFHASALVNPNDYADDEYSTALFTELFERFIETA